MSKAEGNFDHTCANDDSLNSCRELYERENNRWALMQSIWLCAVAKRPLPDWIATAYAKGFEAVRTGSADSWDAVFGPAHPKGSHLQRLRQRSKLMSPVYNRICEIIRDEEAAIDDELFNRVGKELGVGKTTAKKYYYGAMKILYP